MTSYVVLVGDIPGQTAYQFPVGATAIGASGVASGTYYLRVIAMNGTSASPPSAETTRNPRAGGIAAKLVVP